MNFEESGDEYTGKPSPVKIKSRHFFQQRGASMIEYGLLGGLIAVVSMSFISDLGQEVRNTYDAGSIAISSSADEPVPDAPATPDEPDPDAFILQFNTSMVTIFPMGGGAIEVDWGNESANATCGKNFTASGAISCSYPQNGTYNVSITGSLSRYGAYDVRNSDLIKVLQWGNTGLTNLQNGFARATSLIEVPSTLPSSVTNLGLAFRGATSFNQDINNWDVSNVTIMNRMFDSATAFNGNIEDWDVSSVTSFQEMFIGATSFNQDLSKWNVAGATNFKKMFEGASAFNSPLWWNMSGAKNVEKMLSNATAFNQDIGGFNMPLVNIADRMLENTSSFDQNLTSWCVTSLTSEPPSFASGSTLSPGNYPVWGTCP